MFNVTLSNYCRLKKEKPTTGMETKVNLFLDFEGKKGHVEIYWVSFLS